MVVTLQTESMIALCFSQQSVSQLWHEFPECLNFKFIQKNFRHIEEIIIDA